MPNYINQCFCANSPDVGAINVFRPFLLEWFLRGYLENCYAASSDCQLAQMIHADL